MDKQTHPSNILLNPAVPAGKTSTKLYVPAFAYPGGKKFLRNVIASYMPPSGRIYCEPFSGRLNVSLLAVQTKNFLDWHVNDIRMAPFIRALITHANIIEVPEHTRGEFERQKSANPDDPMALLLAPYLTYSGAGYQAGYRSAKGAPLRPNYQITLRRAHDLLVYNQPRITSLDWKLAVSDLGPDDFVYLDPPYREAVVQGYKASDLDHDEMIDLLKKAPFRWLLSEYAHPLYLRAFGEPIFRKDVQLRSTNFRNDRGQARRVECLWRNY
jgi:hypothetical protein